MYPPELLLDVLLVLVGRRAAGCELCDILAEADPGRHGGQLEACGVTNLSGWQCMNDTCGIDIKASVGVPTFEAQTGSCEWVGSVGGRVAGWLAGGPGEWTDG